MEFEFAYYDIAVQDFMSMHVRARAYANWI